MDRFSSFRRHRKNAAPTAAIAGTGSESATTEIVTAAKKRENASPIAQGQPTPLIKLSVPTSTLPEPSEESRPRASTSQHQSTGVDSTTPASDIQQQQVRNQQVKHERLQFSRSPLHSLLRTSMKRSRRSPSPVTAPPVLPASPTAGLSKQIQSISLPSNDNGASPQSSATAIPSSSTEQGRSVTLKSVFHKHTMPHFLNLSPQGEQFPIILITSSASINMSRRNRAEISRLDMAGTQPHAKLCGSTAWPVDACIGATLTTIRPLRQYSALGQESRAAQGFPRPS